MGISVSAGTAVIFIGVFLMLGVLAPGMLNAYDLVSAAEDERNALETDRQQTTIEINSVVVENGSTMVNVTNTGSTALHLSETTILIDNDHVSIEEVTVQTANGMETDLWLPDEVASFTIAETGSDTLVVMTEVGIGDRTTLGGNG